MIRLHLYSPARTLYVRLAAMLASKWGRPSEPEPAPKRKPLLHEGPRPLALPGHLCRAEARAILHTTRKARERVLSRAGVSNRAGRRAYTRRIRLAPV